MADFVPPSRAWAHHRFSGLTSSGTPNESEQKFKYAREHQRRVKRPANGLNMYPRDCKEPTAAAPPIGRSCR